MSSYYSRVLGSLNASEIARSEDIHLIQSGIQTALQEMIRDMFGAGCVLGEGENSLKVTPTAYHIDQQNSNYDANENLISFYDVYLRQLISIDKSEIQSIKVQMRNSSQIAPTIFAEIRDGNFNLIKETNAVLPPNEQPQDITFTFNLNHLPIGEYYFCIRPVDIASINYQNTINNQAYNEVTTDSFKIRCDIDGTYCGGLQASYNGVDYLEARLLGEQVDAYNMSPIIYDNNFDLCFEHIFSIGNTYLVDSAPCMVMGEKVYPIDTHVSLDGPSPEGDRIDLISLDTNGHLNVLKGLPYTGKKTEANYPINTSGLKVAYITTYRTSEPWTCPNCGHANDGNTSICTECETTSPSTKIPLIEQDDENGMTRQRDVLERIRRLEKRMTYNEEHNIPSRIKYTCEIDPTLITKAEKTANGEYVYVEDSYGMEYSTDAYGNKIITSSTTKGNRTLSWALVDNIITRKVTEDTKKFTLFAYDLTIPQTQPKQVDKSIHYLRARLKDEKGVGYPGENITLTITQKTTTQSSSEEGKTQETEKTIKELSNLKTDSDGYVSVNLWKYSLKAGNYEVHTVIKTGAEQKVQEVVTKLTIVKTNTYTIANTYKKLEFNMPVTTRIESVETVDSNTFLGDDSFYKEHVSLDSTEGTVLLSELNPDTQFTSIDLIPSDVAKNLKTSTQKYKIKATSDSLQSEYPVLNFQVDKKCKIKSITPNIVEFQNIKYFTIILFQNDKIFNINTTRSSYTKEINTSVVDDDFPDLFNITDSIENWVEVVGSTDKEKKVKLSKPHKFTFDEITLEPGTYSLAVLGILDDGKEDGFIFSEQYHTADATTYGAASRVKGTSSVRGPKKLYIEGNSLTNKTWQISMEKVDIDYYETGLMISRTITTTGEIKRCSVTSNSYIPDGCSISLFVSNNGGKTYIEVRDGVATFNGSGRDFCWQLQLKGTKNVSPKLFYNDKVKYAIRFELSTEKDYVGYEDYGRCFATPLLNAHNITRNITENQYAKNKFAEWEYTRLWMEDEDLHAKIDVCFSSGTDKYNEDYETSITTPQSKWPSSIFFNQIIADLTLQDFSRESIDYDNYNNYIEPDEYNYRFKIDDNYNGNIQDQIITTPSSVINPGVYDYTYGDITPDSIIMEDYFDYGYVDVPINYEANTGTIENVSTGLHLVSGPYYQAMFDPDVSVSSTGDYPIVWASDNKHGLDFDPESCIIGISFDNGLEIKEEYTELILDIIPNLRDCFEEDKSTGTFQYNSKGETEPSGLVDPTKYSYGPGHKYYQRYYIPKNTLEIVISLNQYGLIDKNNATYGKAYTIKQNLVSGIHNQVSLDLSDLYGSTIYSVGIRVNTGTDENGDPIVHWTNKKHPSLHKEDIIGIGNLYFESNNKKSYTKYLYTNRTDRWNWQRVASNIQRTSRVLAQVNFKPTNSEDADKVNPMWSYINILNKGLDTERFIGGYRKVGTAMLEYQNGIRPTIQTMEYEDGNISVQMNVNGTSYTMNNTNETGDIVFVLTGKDSGSLFEIPVNINLTPYNYVLIQYHLDLPASSVQSLSDNYVPQGKSMAKGDICFDLYDVDDIHGATAIESFALPAWGKIQDQAQDPTGSAMNKTVNAWFKVHSDAKFVKKIVLRRENPTGITEPKTFVLNLVDILFINTETVPALGPQMHVRIYPQSMTSFSNTKIRKFGCVYRLG
ncbi:MAG: hypothetical protein IKF82_00030 [Bacilli bacterium]|nr:hypothetical protein [Bacilli bacterium]